MVIPPIGVSLRKWAAWANGVAVSELDFHDTFLAADCSHPGDNIPPILAVAQHCGLLGGPQAEYHVPLPEKGEPKRAILDTYTRQHSVEYQSQALIDLV
jgi:2-methylcitrate dehydratase PrpD